MAERRIKLADVAKVAGVSQGTASNVFSRPDIVREEVRERVRAAARELGYRGPDPKGRLLRAGKVNAIGVVTAEPLSYFFQDPFARALLASISKACDAAGSGISLVSAKNDEELAWNINSALVDGFILLCVESGEKLIRLTRERGLPFVALELETDDDSIAAIGIDNRGGARRAARHLAELGHRRFAVLSLQLVDDRVGFVRAGDIDKAIYHGTSERIRGYFDALTEFGIDVSEVPVFETENDRTTTREALTQIFGQPEPPTALLAMSDRIAFSAIEWLKEKGISVPNEVSVIGFDGVPEAAHCVPPLTTVSQPIAEMGQRAVRFILDQDDFPVRETLDTTLIVRGSTAAPAFDAA